MTKPSKKIQQGFDDEVGSEPSGSPNQSTSSGTTKRQRKDALPTSRNTPKVQSDQKLDLILQKLATIENQNSVIVNKVKDIEVRVESAEKSIKLVREDYDLLTNSVTKLQADLISNTWCDTSSQCNRKLHIVTTIRILYTSK
jgi:hypothetical protein